MSLGQCSEDRDESGSKSRNGPGTRQGSLSSRLLSFPIFATVF